MDNDDRLLAPKQKPVSSPVDGLTKEEAEVAREASQRAVEDLRERNRHKADMLAIWSPALRDLEDHDEDGLLSMSERLLDAARAHGWEEEKDDRLARLAVCLINDLGLGVYVERHNKSPDIVRIGGYRVGERS
jgi:hypothetical protein